VSVCVRVCPRDGCVQRKPADVQKKEERQGGSLRHEVQGSLSMSVCVCVCVFSERTHDLWAGAAGHQLSVCAERLLRGQFGVETKLQLFSCRNMTHTHTHTLVSWRSRTRAEALLTAPAPVFT